MVHWRFFGKNGSRASGKENESAKYAGKLLEQEQTQKRLSWEIVDGNLKANDLAHQLDSLSKKLWIWKQKNERLRIMKMSAWMKAHMGSEKSDSGSAGRKDERAGHGKRQSDPEKKPLRRNSSGSRRKEKTGFRKYTDPTLEQNGTTRYTEWNGSRKTD